MSCGIYIFTNKINDMKYIGKSINIKERIKSHFYEAKYKKKVNHFKHAIIYYGINNFKWEILEECDINKLNEKEIFWINKLNTKHPRGYNLTDGGEGSINLIQEIRDKISFTLKKRFENKKNHPSTGRKRSEESKEKQRNAMLGKGHPQKQETKELLSKLNKGKHQYLNDLKTEEWRKRQSNIMKGENNSNAKEFIFISPTNEEYIIKGKFKIFCKDNNLGFHSMIKVLNEKQKKGHHKGWKVRYLINNNQED